jgi:hypothetical protein
MYFFINTPDICLKNGNVYNIPISYVDIWESGDPTAAQNHYLITDVNIDESQFTMYFYPSPDPYPYYCFSNCYEGITEEIDNSLEVTQNYPNPTKGSTTVKFTLAETSNVSVEITNMVGQSVSVINHGRLAVGTHNIKLNVKDLTAGIYFYTVTTGNQKVTKKMIVE